MGDMVAVDRQTPTSPLSDKSGYAQKKNCEFVGILKEDEMTASLGAAVEADNAAIAAFEGLAAAKTKEINALQTVSTAEAENGLERSRSWPAWLSWLSRCTPLPEPKASSDY